MLLLLEKKNNNQIRLEFFTCHDKLSWHVQNSNLILSLKIKLKYEFPWDFNYELINPLWDGFQGPFSLKMYEPII